MLRGRIRQFRPMHAANIRKLFDTTRFCPLMISGQKIWEEINDQEAFRSAATCVFKDFNLSFIAASNGLSYGRGRRPVRFPSKTR